MMTCGVSFPASWAERVTEANQFTQGTPLLLPRLHPQLLVIAPFSLLGLLLRPGK
jgi:hypothetical protein